MPEVSSHSREPEEPSPSHRSKRKLRAFFAIIGVGFVLWNIAVTEKRVMDLRSRGFGDVVISSTRDHAYFPMIGAILGSALFISIGLAMKRMMRR